MSQVNPQYQAFLDQMCYDWEQSCKIYYAKDRPEPTWSWASKKTYRKVKDLFADMDVGHVLEIGCGGGLWTRMLLEIADEVTALDVSGFVLEKAREYAPGANYVLGDGQALPNGPFDMVFSWGVFLHLPQEVVYQYIRASARVADSAVFGVRTVEADGIERIKAQHAWGRVPYTLGYIHLYSESIIGAMLDDVGFSWSAEELDYNTVFWAVKK